MNIQINELAKEKRPTTPLVDTLSGQRRKKETLTAKISPS
jgi:hypothetical protein